MRPLAINVNDLDCSARAGAPVALSAEVSELTEQQKKLAGFVKIMDEEISKRIDRASTSQSSVSRHRRSRASRAG